MSASNILSKAREYFEKTKALPYPEDFKIDVWWKSRQEETQRRIACFNSPDEAVRYAQKGHLSGYDHRIFDKDWATMVINFKIRELDRLFPGWSEEGFEESRFSHADSLVNINGTTYSSIYLSHVGQYLRATDAFPHPSHVLEIGGGYGGLARVFKLGANAPKLYVIVDLPESLFYTYLFLALNFPDVKIRYATDVCRYDLSSLDFLLVPAQNYEMLAGESFDIVINCGSLQEMPSSTVNFWMRFIQRVILARGFYSFNYFLTSKVSADSESTNVCPILDPFWKIRHFQINSELLTIDADNCNWLELCVERTAQASDAGELSARAKEFPLASNDWFANMWMAIWCEQRPEYCREILQGIELFRKRVRAAIPKNYCMHRGLSRKAKIKNLIKKHLMKLGIKRPLEFDVTTPAEVDFYQALLRKTDVPNKVVL